VKIGEADGNSVNKRGKKFGKCPENERHFFQQSAAKTMAKSAKMSLKNAILCFVNCTAAELAGIVSPTR
jgi:hypothetical protein